ncbi:MAG TPA: hypothetical protein VJB87_04195 [Candidatus Nanoarchaeia archaeon]|nr:hypothetical protein [Candidatus Nanoarchaeia archaeon]
MAEKTLLERLEEHFIDTTGNVFFSTPFFALLENVVRHQADAQAIAARTNTALFNYLGLGFIFSKGRNLSRNICHLTKTTPELIKSVHDIIYTMLLTTAVTPPIYMFSGTEPKKALIDGLWAGLASAPVGWAIGQGIDFYKDLYNIEPSERPLARTFRNYTSTQKQLIGALGIAASTALTAAIYQATPW